MHYKDLNMIQKSRMKQICDHKYTMEWETPEFMDFIMGELPKIRKSKEDKYIANELVKLKRVLATCDSFMLNKVNFIASGS